MITNMSVKIETKNKKLNQNKTNEANDTNTMVEQTTSIYDFTNVDIQNTDEMELNWYGFRYSRRNTTWGS